MIPCTSCGKSFESREKYTGGRCHECYTSKIVVPEQFGVDSDYWKGRNPSTPISLREDDETSDEPS